MSFSWNLLATAWVPIIFLVSVVIAMDIYRKTAGFRLIRVLFIFIAGIALYGLQVPLYLTSSPSPKKVFIGSAHDELSDSLKLHSDNVFTNLIDWLKADEQIATSSLVVAGTGLENWELAMIQQPFSFIPNKLPEGLLGVTLPPFFQGMQAELAGELLIDSLSTILIELPDGSMKTESVTPDNARFNFQITLPTPGNQLIEISGIRNTDTLFQEQIPVKVQPRPILNTLLLSGFPTFEQRALIEWMESMEYKIATIQQFTEEQYKTNFYNQPIDRKLKTNSSYIKRLDLLILDQAGLTSLTNSTLTTIKSQIRKGELGLLWLDEPDELVKKFDLKVIDGSRLGLLLPTSRGKIKLSSWERYVATTKKSMSSTSFGAILNYGFGTITQPSFTNSYLLKLQGQDSLFSHIWTVLFNATLGHKLVKPSIKTDHYTTVGQKSILELQASIDAEFKVGDEIIYPRQSELDPGRISIEFFPQIPGWQPIYVDDNIIDHLFAAPSKGWQLRRKYLKQELTKMASIRSQELSTPTKQRSKALDNWWWYSILLFSLGGLWIEHRIRS